MSVRPFFVLGCLSGLSLLWTACGGQTTPGSSNEGKEASCSALCAQSAECSDVDQAECEESCTDNEVVSRAGQDLITDCTVSDECDEVDALETLACLEDGLFDLPINEAQEEFCTDTLEELAECGGSPLPDDSVDNCLSGVALLSEEFVTELAECAERRTCDLVNLCVGLRIVTAIDQEQLEALLGMGALMGDIGGLGALEDLFGLLPDLSGLGGAGPN